MAKKYEIIVERDASRVSLDIGQVVPALPAIIAAPDAAQRVEAAASSVEGMAEQARVWAESELPPDPEDLTRKSSRSWALDAQDAADRAGATVAVGNIAALQALEAEADQLAFFDGPGSMALTGLTQAARALLDDPDAATMLTTLGAFPAASVTAQAAQLLDDTSFAAMLATLGAFPAANVTTQAAQLLDDASFAAMRDTLGLGTAATATVTTSDTDTTTGRLLTTGWMGLGADIGVTITDLNQATRSGFYRLPSASAPTGNAPTTSATPWTVLVVINDESPAGWQMAYRASATHEVWVRNFGGATFFPWTKVYTQRSILGTVSQSGGVPTGAVIERGSNANGEYVRFADGTQICIGSASISGGVVGDLGTWTLPAPFSNSSFIVTQTPQSTASNFLRTAHVAGRTTSIVTFHTYSINTATEAVGASGAPVLMCAVGLWY